MQKNVGEPSYHIIYDTPIEKVMRILERPKDIDG